MADSEKSGRKRRAKTAEDYVKNGKVVVLFTAVGDAPILKQNKFMLTASFRFQHVFEFLRKQIGMENIQFQPNPDDVVLDLFKCFHEQGKLHLHYATSLAWG